VYQHKLYNKHLDMWVAPVYSEVNQHFVGMGSEHLEIYHKKRLELIDVVRLAIGYGHGWLKGVNMSNLKVERRKCA
jgi:hypothetical protein